MFLPVVHNGKKKEKRKRTFIERVCILFLILWYYSVKQLLVTLVTKMKVE